MLPFKNISLMKYDMLNKVIKKLVNGKKRQRAIATFSPLLIAISEKIFSIPNFSNMVNPSIKPAISIINDDIMAEIIDNFLNPFISTRLIFNREIYKY